MEIDLAWFPLVLRSRPAGRPLATRIVELERLAQPAADAPRLERITRACEVLNKAALIASDCGLPALACALCWQQYELFEQAKPWPSWAIKLAMQPLLNIARQLIREGHGNDALALLESLFAAARSRTSLTTGGRVIDFGALIATPEDHKAVCTLIWAALLADGTRALAQAGRWQEATKRAAQHRGIGTRLLDGRQVAIIAQLCAGNPAAAAELAEQSQVIEPWEQAVQSVLRVLCRNAAGGVTTTDIATMLDHAHGLVQTPGLATAAARTRIGITALDLAPPCDSGKIEALEATLIALAMQDAYAGYDLLGHPRLSRNLTTSQLQALHALVRGCGLRRGMIPGQLRDELTTAVARSVATLTMELAHAVTTANVHI